MKWHLEHIIRSFTSYIMSNIGLCIAWPHTYHLTILVYCFMLDGHSRVLVWQMYIWAAALRTYMYTHVTSDTISSSNVFNPITRLVLLSRVDYCVMTSEVSIFFYCLRWMTSLGDAFMVWCNLLLVALLPLYELSCFASFSWIRFHNW